MGIETILKLLPQDTDGNSNRRKAFYLRDFLGEFAPSIAFNQEEDLPIELSNMIIAPLPTCRCLSNGSSDNQNRTRSKPNIYTSIQQKNKYGRNPNHYKDNNHSRCHQSVQSIVDDVVYLLVQKREKLRCKRNHERKNSFKRRRKSQRASSNSTSTSEKISSQDDLYCGANTLVHGFGVSREGDFASLPGMKAGITYQHPNENVSFCKSSPIIKKLHEMVGDEVFRMILLHTRCFLPIIIGNENSIRDKHWNRKRKGCDNDNASTTNGDACNYILLCGPPLLFDSNRLQNAVGLSNATESTRTDNDITSSMHSNKKKKRRRAFPSSLVEVSPLRANESLSRFSLMYSDSYVPKVALPKSHPFPQRLEKQKQNKQNNPITSNENQQDQKQKKTPSRKYALDDYNFMLNVIFELHLDNKNKQQRLRKRLKGTGKMVCEQLWKNYTSCNDYGRLLSRYCPLSDVSNEVASARPNDANDTDQHLAKLAHAYTPKAQIVSFLTSVLENVVPDEFWGSNANFRSFLDSVRSFVHLRKQEKLANKNIMHGISINSMQWLYPDFEKTRRSNTNNSKMKRKRNGQRTNHETATELTLQAFRWVFKGFVIPLLRSCFYVTETEFDARELHCYRRPIWSLFRALSLQKITSATTSDGTTADSDPENAKNANGTHFRALPQSRVLQCLQKQKMGISKLRFLPKATGMRPIAQLARSAHIHFMAKETATAAKTAMKSDNLSLHSKRAHSESHSPHPNKKQKVSNSSPLITTMDNSNVRTLQPQSQAVFSRLPTNTMLENVLDVLTYECRKKENPYGNGLGNLQDFYIRYRKYIASLKQSQANFTKRTTDPPKLFFAKIDIEKCYDRIHQNYLLRLVQDMVLHNSYVIQTIKMNCANQKAQMTTKDMGVIDTGPNALRFKKIVQSIEDYESFHRRAYPLVQQQQHTVFETLKCSLVDKPTVLELLREHLLQHFVVATGRHRPKLLLQTRGISQGSTLSMLLCNLYYGRVEELMKLCDIGQTEPSVILQRNGEGNLMSRFVDDFLFVSSNETSFRDFLAKTHRGKPELGATVNPSKTLVNAEASVDSMSNNGDIDQVILSCSDRKMNNDRKVFPWCGLLFDTTTGEVMVDYSRFINGKLRKSLTIDADGREGEQLAQRLRAFLFPRCLPILYDDSINSFATIVTNFYQMMLFGACKTKEYLIGLNSLMKRQKYYIHNKLFLIKCIRGLSGYAIKNIRSKARHCIRNNNDQNGNIDADPIKAFGIHPSIALTLSLQAFYDVFSYCHGFDGVTRLLRENILQSSKRIARMRQVELRKLTARAFDDFRINTMVEK